MASSQWNAAGTDSQPRMKARLWLFGAAACLLLGGTGLAQEQAISGETAEAGAQDGDVLASLRQCRAITDDAARLACYDLSVGKVVEATDAGDVQIVKKEEVEQTRRGLFGFSLPKIGLFSSNDENGEITELASEITRVRNYGRSGYLLTIAEGSVWRITSAPSRLRRPRVGDAVVLKKASLGSFFIRIAGQTGVKGRRIE
jgi:hypothetical protein